MAVKRPHHARHDAYRLRCHACRDAQRPGMHYTRPIFASRLPTYSLTEQDFIKSAFLPTSHVSISKLPHKLK
jgi:hypothetical protein